MTRPRRLAEMLLTLLLALSALLGTSAVNSCLDPTNADYRCELDPNDLVLGLCDLTDDDVEDLATCLDDAGREAIGKLYLEENALTTLPEGLLAGLTGLTALFLHDNALTTLPEGLFADTSAIISLFLNDNALTTLPEGLFHGLVDVKSLWLHNNALTTLPEGVFEGLTGLTNLRLDGNFLECLPTVPAQESITADEHGDECGCSIPGVVEDVCGQETCTPGPVGYTCELVLTPSPTLVLTPPPTVGTEVPLSVVTSAPESAPETTPPPGSGSEASSPPLAAASPAPTPAPSFGNTSIASPGSTPSEQQSAADSTPIVAGVLSAVAGAGLIALAIFLGRRRASRQKTTPPAPSTHDDDILDQGLEQPPDVRPPAYQTLVAGSGDNKPPFQHNVSPHRHTQVEADEADGGGIAPPSAPAEASLDTTQVRSSAEHADNAVKDRDAGLAGDDAAGGSAEKHFAGTAPIATASTANMSTTERDEVAQFHQRRRAGDAASTAGGPKPDEASGRAVPGASSDAGRRNSGGDIGIGHAVLAAAQELALHCQVPGVSEAAAAVCIMANMATDSRDNVRASESRLRLCRTIVLALKRAAKVAEKGEDTIGEVARVLIEEVHEAIYDLVELIQTFHGKNKLSKLFMSTLFKRRQEELDAVVDRAIMRLQLGLQLHVGQDVNAVKAAQEDIKDGLKSVKEEMHLYQRSITEAELESVVEARSIKRRRKLDQVEIPEEHLSMTDELLGKGGFGEVYVADYNGHNAAVKVIHIAHDVGPLDENQRRRETSQRRAFLRELEAMIRLRSDNTVNVYGAVTSLPDRMMLVMELLAGGDLLALLRESKEPFPEEHSRRIIRDICTGMAFLHSKNTVHGDLKSANVLLDGDGRAKIADFGTSRWTQHTNSTGLATYTIKASQTTQMSVAWSAPEVLDSEGSSYASDVYSFGIVVWEVISRKLPWSNKTRPTEIMFAVLKGIRPSFRVDAPADIVDIAKACWCGEPKERTTFRAILEGMKAKGWVVNDE